jgi:hypothetical protein
LQWEITSTKISYDTRCWEELWKTK